MLARSSTPRRLFIAVLVLYMHMSNGAPAPSEEVDDIPALEFATNGSEFNSTMNATERLGSGFIGAITGRPPRKPPGNNNFDGDSPSSHCRGCIKPRNCFARETTFACRLDFPTADVVSAYDDCFGDGLSNKGAATRVKMVDLMAGDWVLGQPWEPARVILNQHRSIEHYAEMVRIDHSGGALELTPDHVLPINGLLAPAASIIAGSNLEGGVVKTVTQVWRAVINPLTSTGFIMAAGSTEGPILATHSAFMAGEANVAPAGLLTTSSLLRSLSMFYPQSFQQFCDAAEMFDDSYLAGSVTGAYGSLDMTAKKMPQTVAWITQAALDTTISAIFLSYQYAWPAITVLAAALGGRSITAHGKRRY